MTQYDYQKIDNIPVISLKSHCLEGAKFHSLGFSMSDLFIGDYAFQNCNVWNAAAIDELFKCFSIGINAFSGCTALKWRNYYSEYFLTDLLLEIKGVAFSNNTTWNEFTIGMSYQGLDKLIVASGVFKNTPIEPFKTIHGLVP